MSRTENSQFDNLSLKVIQLLELLERLEKTAGIPDEQMKEVIATMPDGGRLADLEAELQRLRKENKTLKERERLIQNKIERLSAKLDKIEL